MVRLVMTAVAAVTAFAQQPSIAGQEAARARLLLHSSRYVDKAWGAYFAGRLHTRDLAEDVIAEFRTAGALAGASNSSEEYAFVAALFDAAIEGGIDVPPATLAPFEARWSQPILVLLSISRNGDRQDTLLRLANTKYDLAWLAANNLLFGMRSPKWYAGILGEISITQRFEVFDPGAVPANNGGVGGGTCGDGSIAFPDGFPPIAYYSLEEKTGTREVLLAPGPTNVYYERIVVPTGEHRGFGSCFSVKRMESRIAYLAALANTSSSKTEDLLHRQTRIEYNGVEEFQRKATQALQIQEQEIRDLVRAIRITSQLSASGAVLQIVPIVDDHRRSGTPPLPVVPTREIVLE